MKKLIALLALATLAITAIALPVFTEFPLKLVYNASPSAPYGFYRIDHASGLKRGVFTVVPTPPVFRWLAAKNHYLPFNVPLIKRVVAMSGDEICRIKQTIFINQKRVATALIRDSQHRRLPVWQGCLILKNDQFFALMDNPVSFDGRYFGPLNTKDVIGIAVPIFIWNSDAS